IWDAMSTDLRAFRAHGGKLIMWQGWSDNGIPPSGTVDYYDVLSRRMGGLRTTQQFARLFMVPSVYHCGGSYAGATVPDMIYPMVQWVEAGSAPSQLTVQYGSTATRPVYPYPEIPRYNGSGSTNDAASFHPVTSPGAHYTAWIGNYLFYEPIGGGGGADQGYARRG
ncbi:MAG: tannase/feruloyl esterase family alpha/beta hydrolase, partial [Solirubrobacterales bacterium]|nr:tannase/feruloyl esterase family alpha/beta hydrolase [Solirubrobacterales bacterium]